MTNPELIRKRYPNAICVKMHVGGWAVYTRKWGAKLSVAKTRQEAYVLAVKRMRRGIR